MDATRRSLIVGSAAAGMTACDQVVLTDEPSYGAGIPEITPTEDFYVYSCCGVPAVTAETWTCTVRDRGADVATIDSAWLAAQQYEEIEHTLQCIGSSPRNPAISNALWEGLLLSDVLALLGVAVDPTITGIRLLGYDGYDAVIPVSDLTDAPLRLVWRMNGAPLTLEHGFPARLLVPGRYGVKNVKWLQEIELLDEPYEDYWTGRGWDPDAAYKANGFILGPLFGTSVKSGTTENFVGTAVSSQSSASYTFDGFATTEDCVLDYAPGANRWTLWHFPWTPTAAGTYTAQIRVTTASGVVSNADPFGSDPLAGYDGGAALEVDVT